MCERLFGKGCLKVTGRKIGEKWVAGAFGNPVTLAMQGSRASLRIFPVTHDVEEDINRSFSDRLIRQLAESVARGDNLRKSYGSRTIHQELRQVVFRPTPFPMTVGWCLIRNITDLTIGTWAGPSPGTTSQRSGRALRHGLRSHVPLTFTRHRGLWRWISCDFVEICRSRRSCSPPW